MMEEEVVRYDNIINNIGSKRPGEEGEWVLWEKKIREDRERGRIYQKDWKYIQKTANKNENELVLEPDEAPRTISSDTLGFEDVKFVPVRVNREHIPYEFPRGKSDRRFYHPMKVFSLLFKLVQPIFREAGARTSPAERTTQQNTTTLETRWKNCGAAKESSAATLSAREFESIHKERQSIMSPGGPSEGTTTSLHHSFLERSFKLSLLKVAWTKSTNAAVSMSTFSSHHQPN